MLAVKESWLWVALCMDFRFLSCWILCVLLQYPTWTRTSTQSLYSAKRKPLPKLVVKFIPPCSYSEFWSREFWERIKVQFVGLGEEIRRTGTCWARWEGVALTYRTSQQELTSPRLAKPDFWRSRQRGWAVIQGLRFAFWQIRDNLLSASRTRDGCDGTKLDSTEIQKLNSNPSSPRRKRLLCAI